MAPEHAATALGTMASLSAGNSFVRCCRLQLLLECQIQQEPREVSSAFYAQRF